MSKQFHHSTPSPPSKEPFGSYRERRQAHYLNDLGVIYRRESDPSATGAKRRGESRGTLPKQLEDCTAYADALGLSVVGEYVELEQGDVWGRPMLQRMLADLRAGKFSHIIMQHPDRLSRSDEVRTRFKIAVREAHGKYHFANLPLAAENTLEGRMVEKTAGIVSDLEKHRIRERTQSMRQMRARSGDKIIAGGYPKYGYNWVRDTRLRIVTYEIDEETAPIVREIMGRLAAGEPVKRIVDDLNRRGVPTRGEILKRRGLLSPRSAARVSNHWKRNAIAEIVFTPDYSGIHLNYHTISEYEDRTNPFTGIAGPRKRNYLLRPSERHYLPLEELLDEYGDYAVPVPALVDAGVQLAAQYRFRANAGTRQPPADTSDVLLRGGYVCCGHCKHPMAVRRDKKRPQKTDYFCAYTRHGVWTTIADCPVTSNQIYARLLDDAVWSYIRAALKQPGIVVTLLTRAHDVVDAESDRTNSMLAGARRDLDAANAEMQALAEQTMLPEIHLVARQALNKQMTEVGERIAQLEDIIRETQEEAVNQQAYLARVEGVRDWAATLSDGIDKADYETKRNILFMLGVKVYVWRKDDRDPERNGLRWKIITDWEGLNLGGRFGIERSKSYTSNSTNNNNARNYSLVNAFDMQALLGQPVGKGEPLPSGIEETIAERAEKEKEADQGE